MFLLLRPMAAKLVWMNHIPQADWCTDLRLFQLLPRPAGAHQRRSVAGTLVTPLRRIRECHFGRPVAFSGAVPDAALYYDPNGDLICVAASRNRADCANASGVEPCRSSQPQDLLWSFVVALDEPAIPPDSSFA
jgi:hypothetical protein